MFIHLKTLIGSIFLIAFTILCSVNGAHAQAANISGGDLFAVGKGKVGNTDGGPWSPASRTYTITNPGLIPISWTAQESINGMSLLKTENGVISTVSSLSGFLGPLGSHTITLVVDPNADQIAPGVVRNGRLIGFVDNKAYAFDLKITATGEPEISVTASEVFEATGPVKGPFMPESRSYRITNVGLLPVDWSVSENVLGMNAEPTSGSLNPGQVTSVRVRVDNEAQTLPAGESRYGLLSFTNNTNGLGDVTRRLKLTATVDARMEVSPNLRYSVSGVEGLGPFSAPSRIYTVSNIGARELNYKLTSDIRGFSFDNGTTTTSGIVPAGGTKNIRISVNDDAKSVRVGSPRLGRLSFINVNNGLGDASRNLRITALKIGSLNVSNADGFISTGPEGGPFRPIRKTYTLKNTGRFALNFEINENHQFMRVSQTNGTLAAGEAKTVYVAVTGNPETVSAPSIIDGLLTFTNTTTGETQTRQLRLKVETETAANDDVANAEVITGTTGSDLSEGNMLYTMETGERRHSAEGTAENGRSAWWKWTAPTTGQMQFNSFSSVGDTVISAYISPTATPNVRTLTQIASNNDADSGFDGKVFIHAIAGKSYYFAIAARNKVERLEGIYTLRWGNMQGTTPGLFASVLPGARSVRTGNIATAFGSIVNTSNTDARDCYISMPSKNVGSSMFQFQRTNAANATTGRPNTPTNIAAGASQGFVFAITPSRNLTNGTDIELVFDCANMAPVTSIVGLNTLLLSSAASQPADMIAIANTVNGNGIVDIPGNNGTGFFAAAVVNNNGPTTTITASVDTGDRTLPVRFTLCQTNAGGACLAPPSATVSFSAAPGTPKTFSVFIKGNGRVAFDPALNRAFLRFKEGAITRGATSVAIRTQ